MLVKTPKGKEMGDTDVFAFNNKFTDRQRKIKMSLLVTKVSTNAHSIFLLWKAKGPDSTRVADTHLGFLLVQVSQDEKLSTKQTVDEDRKHAVEASIVRVMKARKTMPHQQLVMEVSQQLMKLFKPDPKVIKNRIESLISREVITAVTTTAHHCGLLRRDLAYCVSDSNLVQYLERDKDNNGVYKYLA